MEETSLIRLLSLNYADISSVYQIISSIASQTPKPSKFSNNLVNDLQFISKLRSSLLAPTRSMLGLDQSSDNVLLKEMQWILREMKRNFLIREQNLSIGNERLSIQSDLRKKDNSEVLKGIRFMHRFEETKMIESENLTMGFDNDNEIADFIKVTLYKIILYIFNKIETKYFANT